MKFFFNDLVLIQLLIKKNSPMKKLFLPIFALCFSAALFAANTAGTLTFTVTTVSAGSVSGKYIRAIFITNSTTASSATFVKTLLKTTSGDKSHLKQWVAAGSNTTGVISTGATTSTYGVVTCDKWDGKNTAGAYVADGDYTVWCDISDDPDEAYSKWTFAKGTAPVTITGTVATNFTNITLAWVPVNTAINDVEMEKYYSVYPNPAVSSIYVSGEDVKEVQICSLNGQILMTSNEQSVNISKLAKGNYLAVIRAKNGTVVKKIQKL